MADNIAVEPSGHSDRVNVATDEVSGVHYPIYRSSFKKDDNIVLVEEKVGLPVNPDLEKTSFGELAVAELTPVLQVQFPYSINPEIISNHSNGGTATVTNNMATLSTGAATNQSSEIHTVESIKYQPGQGTLARFTGKFTTGVAGSTQVIGIGTSSDGFFFGYNGADFGVLRRSGGAPEIRALTITTPSTTAENITITLDGVAKTDVTVTASGDASTTAHEIAAADYSSVGSGWHAHSPGNGKVVFHSFTSSVQVGSYSLSGATTAVGVFAQLLAGVVPTETWINQASWNHDKANNTHLLPLIDFTKGNVFEIRYQWLGFGLISFYIENPSTGEYINVHAIEYANANTEPSISNPTLPLYAFVGNTTNNTDIVLQSGSMAAFVEGKEGGGHIHHGHSVEYTGIGTTETPILTIHNKPLFQGKENRVRIKLIVAAFSVEGTKPSTIRIRKGALLTGASYNDINTAQSVIEYDETATALANGDDQLALGMSKADSEVVDLDGKSYFLNAGEFFTISGKASSGSIEGVISINWEELF